MVAGGERERLLNGIVLISLSRNSFSDLRDASVDKPKPRFASSISLSANRFFLYLVNPVTSHKVKLEILSIPNNKSHDLYILSFTAS